MPTWREPSPGSSPGSSPSSSPPTSFSSVKTKQVRLLVDLTPPPEEMPDEPSSSSRRQRQVRPDVAPTTEKFTFGSSCVWSTTHLNHLGVKFSPSVPWPWKKFTHAADKYSGEQQDAINRGIQELSSLEIDDLNDMMDPEDDIGQKICYFQSTYKTILKLLIFKKSAQRYSASPSAPVLPSIPPSSSHKRPASADLANQEPLPKRANPLETQTPEQSTALPDPSFTSGSGTSKESGPEDVTRRFIQDFVSDTMVTLGADFRTLSWTQSSVRTRLIDGGSNQMHFNLGTETITSINDGGINIAKVVRGGKSEWIYRSKRTLPVLSFEAKRKNHKNRKDPDIVRKYSAQIFCEMLGQVCHKRIFENSDTEYQEAFVVHGTHDILCIYHAHLPNEYLAAINRHGANFKDHCSVKEIRLYRSKRYHMRITQERCDFFELFARVLFYLKSGKSHAGYLYNYPTNPIHSITDETRSQTEAHGMSEDNADTPEPPVMQDSITVRMDEEYNSNGDSEDDGVEAQEENS